MTAVKHVKDWVDVRPERVGERVRQMIVKEALLSLGGQRPECPRYTAWEDPAVWEKEAGRGDLWTFPSECYADASATMKEEADAFCRDMAAFRERRSQLDSLSLEEIAARIRNNLSEMSDAPLA